MKLSKAYEPQTHENDIYKLWEEKGAFTPKNRGNNENFSIVVPPPNANGNLHIGHGLNMSIMDVLTRYNRMKGKASLLLPGADHAGFETWVVYEKMLNKQGKSRFDFSREELYAQIWDFVAENKENFRQQFKKLGASVDWDRYVYTLDDKIVNQAYTTFKKMWDEGLIYRAEKLVNYCTHHGTGFADIEVSHKESAGTLWYIRYPLTDASGEIIVATTRPETMLGDTAVAVHPDDARYKQFIGKTIKLPLTNREIPIIADDYVDQKYGTGAVKITPAHDPNDYDIAQRHDLPMISVIDHKGLITHDAPEGFAGLNTKEARNKVVDELTSNGSLTKTEEITHNVGHCYKCDTVLEPLLQEQWFIDMKPLAKRAIDSLESNAIKFFPDSKRKQLTQYLEELRDWNISRQIAWGIPIPAFQNIDQPDDWIFDTRTDQETIELNGSNYRRDKDVFDTWFSSSSWPYATLSDSGEDLEKFYPLDVMETGSDILYPWVSRMIMMGLYTTNKIPFKSVYMHGLIQDEQGQKMSKSKGNVVNPMDKIEEFGSDAFRIGILMGESAGIARPYNEPKVIGGRNFCNKLWNIARFIQDQAENKSNEIPAPKSISDHWMLSKLQQSIDKTSSLLDENRFSEAIDTVYHFVWDDFADWYIEASKESPNIALLQFGLESILKLCHPFAPFVTEAIWQNLGWSEDLLITSTWASGLDFDGKSADDFTNIQTIVTEIRRLSKAMSLQKPSVSYYSSLISENKELLIRLAKLSEAEQMEQGSGLALTATSEPVWLEIDKETIKGYAIDLKNQLSDQEKLVKNFRIRLGNENYVVNAPEKVVEQTREQLSIALERIEQIEQEISKVEA